MNDDFIIDLFIEKAVNISSPNSFSRSISPYVSVKLNSTNLFKTSTISNSFDPIFNQNFHIKTKNLEDSFTNSLCLELYDYKLIGKDNFIGSVSISLNFLKDLKKTEKTHFETPIFHAHNGFRGTLFFYITIMKDFFSNNLTNISFGQTPNRLDGFSEWGIVEETSILSFNEAENKMNELQVISA